MDLVTNKWSSLVSMPKIAKSLSIGFYSYWRTTHVMPRHEWTETLHFLCFDKVLPTAYFDTEKESSHIARKSSSATSSYSLDPVLDLGSETAVWVRSFPQSLTSDAALIYSNKSLQIPSTSFKFVVCINSVWCCITHAVQNSSSINARTGQCVSQPRPCWDVPICEAR